MKNRVGILIVVIVYSLYATEDQKEQEQEVIVQEETFALDTQANSRSFLMSCCACIFGKNVFNGIINDFKSFPSELKREFFIKNK